MTYTVSHRQGGVQRSAVGGLIRHEFRDIDKHNGVETQHSNERIVPERTELNQSVIFIDGEAANFTDSRQITEELDRRLSEAGGTRTNKKTGEVSRIAVRKDAKVVRDIVLQLDPTFTRSSELLMGEDADEEHRAEVQRLLEEMIEHYGEVYGRHNLLAASLHWDETSPHVHLLVTPIDEEGRVRQESFIGGRQAMRENDRAMRRRLAGAGYDVDPEPRGGSRSNMSIDEYSQWQQRIEEVKAREVAVEDGEVRLRKNRGVQKGNKEWLEKRKADQDAREGRLAAREAATAQKVAEAEKVRQAAAQALSAAKEAEELALAAKTVYAQGAVDLDETREVLVAATQEAERLGADVRSVREWERGITRSADQVKAKTSVGRKWQPLYVEDEDKPDRDDPQPGG